MKDIPTQKLILIGIALTAIVAYVIPFDDLIAQQEEEGDGNGVLLRNSQDSEYSSLMSPRLD